MHLLKINDTCGNGFLLAPSKDIYHVYFSPKTWVLQELHFWRSNNPYDPNVLFLEGVSASGRAAWRAMNKHRLETPKVPTIKGADGAAGCKSPV